ncbi:cysteine-rich PDZ-binding protein isoform 2-T2 [Morus bassanus]
MVCEKCEKKLGTVITPDTWKDGARNTTESGGRKLNENKALTSKKARFDPYGKNKFAICRICKSSVHQPGSHYCQGCAYKKGIYKVWKREIVSIQLQREVRNDRLISLTSCPGRFWRKTRKNEYVRAKSLHSLAASGCANCSRGRNPVVPDYQPMSTCLGQGLCCLPPCISHFHPGSLHSFSSEQRERGKQAWREKDLCKIAGSTEGTDREQEE